MFSDRPISIWFFIGCSLLVNGGLILAAGLYELSYPPQYAIVLFHLHASIWWGGLLLALGVFYCYRFAPGHANNGTEVAGPHSQPHANS